jgi:hypothetical protein
MATGADYPKVPVNLRPGLNSIQVVVQPGGGRVGLRAALVRAKPYQLLMHSTGDWRWQPAPAGMQMTKHLQTESATA